MKTYAEIIAVPHVPTRHARLGPSSASRWMACPGSPRLVEGLPHTTSSYAEEGTRAHALAAYCLEHAVLASAIDGVPPEMATAIDLFLTTVREGPGEVLAEQAVTLAPLDPPEEMFGTADAIRVNGRELHVYDLKYGRGVSVDAETPQLGYYAIGAVLLVAARKGFLGQLSAWALNADVLSLALNLFTRVTVTIVQPRQANPIRTAVLQEREPEGDGAESVIDAAFSTRELQEFGTTLLGAAQAAHAPDAPLVAGPQCRFCPAKAICPAIKSYSMALAQADFDVVPVLAPPAPESLPLAVAADLLAKVPVLEAWAKALRERVEAEVRAGVEVPGWKLVEKRPRRTWRNEQDVLDWSSQHLSLDEVYEERALRSPAQIEKLVGKKNLPATLYTKASSGLALVPASDPRPAAGRLSAQAEFAALPPAPDVA